MMNIMKFTVVDLWNIIQDAEVSMPVNIKLIISDLSQIWDSNIAKVYSAWVVNWKKWGRNFQIWSAKLHCYLSPSVIKRFTKHKNMSCIHSCLSTVISFVCNLLDTVWVTWLSLITSVVSLVVLILVKQRFTRLDLEEEDNSTTPDIESSSSCNKSA